ncbi:hypothetical protein DFQ26_004685 [Actinomortierella ambigua]|nr:hypothetical protein DFQ26_004685 [Actinomortierella ambigua]
MIKNSRSRILAFGAAALVILALTTPAPASAQSCSNHFQNCEDFTCCTGQNLYCKDDPMVGKHCAYIKEPEPEPKPEPKPAPKPQPIIWRLEYTVPHNQSSDYIEPLGILVCNFRSYHEHPTHSVV